MIDIDMKAINLAKFKQAGIEVEKALGGRQLMINTAKTLDKRFRLLSKEAFLTGGHSTGKLWKPLSRKYAANKSLHYPGKDILRRTDQMYKSYTRKGSTVNLFFRSPEGYSYQYGSKDKKKDWHHKGTKNMPARKIIQYTPQQLLGITASIRRVLYDTVLKRKFFDRVPSVGLAIKNSGFDRVNLS